MLIACWSAKGGSGTTVVSAALALLAARSVSTGVLLVDLMGDSPAVLGIPEPAGLGLAQWMAAGPDVGSEALARLELPADRGLHLLAAGVTIGGDDPVTASRMGYTDEVGGEPAGQVGGEPVGEAPPPPSPSRPGRADELATALTSDRRLVVADCGTLVGPGVARAGPGLALAAGATLSLLVIRPCYLALRRAMAAPLRPSAIVLINEPGRCLGRANVEDALGVPVRVELALDPAVARAVDSGLLAGRIPRALEPVLRVTA